MYKIAILGTENSHALNFAKLINGGHPMRNGRGYADFKVVGVYGYDDAANKQIQNEAGVEMIAQNLTDFVGKVDAVMITARHGDNHYSYAKPYLDAGIPMFVDKPITIDEKEAVLLAKTAKEKNIPLCGGSCCALVTSTQQLKNIVASTTAPLGKILGGSVCAPINLRNEYGDFYFYSQHLVQTSMEIFGYDVKRVRAVQREDSVSVMCGYDRYEIANFFGPQTYSAVVYGSKSNLYLPIDIDTDAYAREVEAFADMIRSGRMHQTYEDFIKPVFVLNAIKKSMDTNTETEVGTFTL
jgi:Predicted dehydrogenases and related proteins